MDNLLTHDNYQIIVSKNYLRSIRLKRKKEQQKLLNDIKLDIFFNAK